MNNEAIVINSGPLILLHRIQEMDIFAKMPYRFICPPAVRDELDAGVHFGHTVITGAWYSQKLIAAVLAEVGE